MAAGGLFAFLDDIFSMTKVATIKTMGVTGDDLAVSSQMMAGLTPNREYHVLGKAFLGSIKNKIILTPALLGISAVSAVIGVPLIAPLLIMGGTYLSYEGMEKVVEKLFHKEHSKDHKEAPKTEVQTSPADDEKKRVKSLVKLDFIMSAEILVIALGTAAAAPLLSQLGMLAGVGAAMSLIVYSLVGGIIGIDNLGAKLKKKSGNSPLDKVIRGIGEGILRFEPFLQKSLSVIGTVAMFYVGGGILMHNIPALAELVHHAPALIELGASIAAGAVAGVAAVAGHKLVAPIIDKIKPHLPKINLPKISLPKFPFGRKKEATVESTPAPVAAPQIQAESKLAATPDLSPVMNEAAAKPAEAGEKKPVPALAPKPSSPPPPTP